MTSEQPSPRALYMPAFVIYQGSLDCIHTGAYQGTYTDPWMLFTAQSSPSRRIVTTITRCTPHSRALRISWAALVKACTMWVGETSMRLSGPCKRECWIASCERRFYKRVSWQYVNWSRCYNSHVFTAGRCETVDTSWVQPCSRQSHTSSVSPSSVSIQNVCIRC